MKLYHDILKTAWHHTIHRPGLWLFGFFSTFVFGASGEIDRYLRFMNSVVKDGHLLNARSWLDGHWSQVISQIYSQLVVGNVTAWLFVAGIILAGLVAIFMMSISVGALIHSAKYNTESFSEAFTAGYKHWLQLAVLFVSAYVLVVVTTLAMVTGVLNLIPAATSIENSQLTIVMIAGVVFIPLVIVVSFLIRLSAMTIVLDRVHLGTAMRRAWLVFVKHWLIVLEMAILNFVVVGVASLALLIGLVIIFLPFFVMISLGSGSSAIVQLQDTLFFGQWLYLLVSFFSAALLSTWQWSAWTNLFETLRNGQPTSSLVRFIRSVK